MKKKQVKAIDHQAKRLYTYAEIEGMMDRFKEDILDAIRDGEDVEAKVKSFRMYWLEMENATEDEVMAYIEDEKDMDNIADEFRRKDMLAGYIIIKPDSMVKEDKIREFLCTEIYPYYNEQCDNLF